MIRRFADVILRPRATMTALARQPVWLAPWLAILAVWAASGLWFLQTDVGQQALVDEKVRLTEAFGGSVSDTDYERWLAAPPASTYLTSGGRVLLNPVVTLVAAVGLWTGARLERRAPTWTASLAVAVHATVVLGLGQLVALPFQYVRESLATPVTLATLVPVVEAGTIVARILGAIDVFAVWWVALLAVGLGALTGQRVGRYLWLSLGGLAAGAAGLVAVMTALGGVV